MTKNIAILGSTGSIGRQTLEVVSAHPESFAVAGLACGVNIQELRGQIREVRPSAVSVASEADAHVLQKEFPTVSCFWGPEGLCRIASLPQADCVLVAVVGSAGLRAVLEAISHGKTVLLANKETLVAGGSVVRKHLLMYRGALIPVDSEHSAIFQCLKGENRRQLSPEQLDKVRPEDALKHPTWLMGAKITIDSATMMNKGLEVIEARWLFDLPATAIEVVIHPQSIIHSMVEFQDGSVLAHMSLPDMRLPIQYALTYPERLSSSWPRMNPAQLGTLTFFPPDRKKFPCLDLAYGALEKGGTWPAAMNAANEVSVELFLSKRIGFSAIPSLIAKVLEAHKGIMEPDMEDILEADRWAREEASHHAGASHHAVARMIQP
ncbi:MAG: 1-deoxy-D-xylulose-5-phosphate reductoisomerase [Armatimonadetes bacterium]|nr:1-deoxy-D-xylulose-5-phosphate reductoisomerase [Armatimonadota bacterium]